MPKTAALKKKPSTKPTTKKVAPKAIKKALLKDEKKEPTSSTPKVISRKASVELKRSESLKS
jgi:hypothetical protein